MKNSGIILVGGIPHPIGGVTNHIWRLAIKLGEYDCEVLDRFPASKKYSISGVECRVSPFSSVFLTWLWVFWRILLSHRQVVHFHFSTTKGVAVLGVFMLLACIGKRTVLTLHCGDQWPHYKGMPTIFRYLARFVICRLDALVALNPDHKTFFKRLGASEGSIVLATSFIAPPTNLQPTNDVKAFADNLKGSSQLLFVGSGFPTAPYRHEHCIEVVRHLRKSTGQECRLVLCLYGEGDDSDYQQKLGELIQNEEWVFSTSNLDIQDFLYVLGQADVYLRPFVDDSCGLAVCEAICLGVPAIATDSCERYPGTIVYECDNLPEMQSRVVHLVAELPQAKQALIAHSVGDSFEAILSAYG